MLQNNKIQKISLLMLTWQYLLPYFFYIFDHLKIIIFFADQIIGITPKLTKN